MARESPVFAFEVERRIAADDAQLSDFAQAVDQFFGKSIREIFLRRIAALVHQRQHGDRFFASRRPRPVRWLYTARARTTRPTTPRRSAPRKSTPGRRVFPVRTRSFVGARNPLRRKLERPRDYQCDRESGGDQCDKHLHYPRRGFERREEDRGELQQKPRRPPHTQRRPCRRCGASARRRSCAGSFRKRHSGFPAELDETRIGVIPHEERIPAE